MTAPPPGPSVKAVRHAPRKVKLLVHLPQGVTVPKKWHADPSKITCGNCSRPGHQVRECVGPLDPYGYIDACPMCNTRVHNFDTCPLKMLKDKPSRSLTKLELAHHLLVIWRQKKPPIASNRCWVDVYKSMKGKITSSHPLLASESLEKYRDDWKKFDYSLHYGDPNSNSLILGHIVTPLPKPETESRSQKVHQQQAREKPNMITKQLRQEEQKAFEKLVQHENTITSTEVVVKSENDLIQQDTALSVPAWVRDATDKTSRLDDQLDTPATCPSQDQDDTEMEIIVNMAEYDTTPAEAIQTPIKTESLGVTTRSSSGKRKPLASLDDNQQNKKQKLSTDAITLDIKQASSTAPAPERWSSRLRSSMVKREPGLEEVY